MKTIDRTIKAKLPATGLSNGRQQNKELVKAESVIGYRNGRMVEVCCARHWMGRSSSASTVYSAVWINDGKEFYTSGRGVAGGGGYCKKSAALDSAIRSAGIELSRSVHATGETREALEAIARACGFRKLYYVSH